MARNYNVWRTEEVHFGQLESTLNKLDAEGYNLRYVFELGDRGRFGVVLTKQMEGYQDRARYVGQDGLAKRFQNE